MKVILALLLFASPCFANKHFHALCLAQPVCDCAITGDCICPAGKCECRKAMPSKPAPVVQAPVYLEQGFIQSSCQGGSCQPTVTYKIIRR